MPVHFGNYKQVTKLSGAKEYPWPTIDLDKWDVLPGNSASTNQASIANMITRLRSANIPGFHVRLNRAGTFLLQRGTNGSGLDLYATRKACILLPSNCKFELSSDTELKLEDDNSSYLFRNDDPVNGNVNIELCGGVWNGNKAGSQPSDYDTGTNQGWFETIMWGENITNFRIHDVTFTDPAIWASAWSKLYRALFERIYFDACDRDGLHFVGECYDVTLRGIAGTCHDNMIAISTSQGSYFGGRMQFAGGAALAGDHERFLIDDVNADDCDGPIAMFGRDTEHIHNVHINNLRGTTGEESAGAIQVPAYALIGNNVDIRGLRITNVDIKTKVGEPVVSIADVGCKDLIVDNIRISNGAGIVLGGSSWETITISNVTNPSTSNGYLLQLGNDALSSPFDTFHAKSIQLNNVSLVHDGSDQNLINIQEGATWDSFQINSLNYDGVNSARLVEAQGTTRRELKIGTAAFKGGPGVFVGPLDVDASDLTVFSQSYIAEGGAHVRANRINVKGTSRLLCDGGGMLQVGLQRLQMVLDYTDLTPTDSTAALVLATQLPRGAVVTGVAYKSRTAFTGGAISVCTVQIRKSSTTFGTAYDLFAAADSTHPDEQAIDIDWAMNEDPAINFLVSSNGANLIALTAGRAYITVEYYITGMSQT